MLVKRLLFPVSLGLFGVSILCMLGIWQINRLNWKNNLIHEVSTSIAMEPQALNPTNIGINSQYLPVTFEGKFYENEIHVLFSLKPYGPGFKVIRPFEWIMFPGTALKTLLPNFFQSKTAFHYSRILVEGVILEKHSSILK